MACFVGYHLHSGGRWSGDCLVLDTERYAKNPDTGHDHLHRIKDIVVLAGRWVFPVKEGLLRHRNPEAHDQIHHDTSRPLGEIPVDDPLSLFPAEWDDPSSAPHPKPDLPDASHHTGRPDSPHLPESDLPEAAEPAAAAPQQDYWELRGDIIIRHIQVPLTQLFRPTDDLEGIPVPVDRIDVTRDFETTSSFEGE